MNISLDRNQRIRLAVFLAAVLVFSLSYSFYFRIDPSVDARAYDAIGWNLASGNGYRESAEVPIAEDNSIVRVGPGYEFFLAAIYYIFGHSFPAVWVFQGILLALSALLIFLTTREIFSGRESGGSWNFTLGMAAAVLIGFSPDLMTLQGMIMTETLGVFLIILSTYLFFRYVNYSDRPYLRIILMSAALVAAVAVRTPAAFLAFPMAAYFIFSGRRRHLLAFALSLLIFLSPWTIRNYLIYRSFIPTNLAYGIDLAAGNHPGATGELEPYDRNDRLIAEYGYLKANSMLAKETLAFILNNPLEFMRITVNRTAIYFSFSRPTGFWFHLEGLSRALTLILSSAYSAVLFITGFWGIYEIRKLQGAEKNKAVFLAALLLMMPLAIVGIIVETRYRFLCYPFFAIFSGLAVSRLSGKGASELRAYAYIASVLILNTAVDIFRNWSRIVGRLNEF